MTTRRVTVIVNEKPYDVEFDELVGSNVNVMVNGQPFTVEVGCIEVQGGSNGNGQAGQSIPVVPRPVVAAPRVATPAPASAPRPAPVSPTAAPAGGSVPVIAPMPGTILAVCVQPGDKVKVKQDLCVLEAMKLKNVIRAPRDGVVTEVKTQVGKSVAYGEVLVILG